MSADVQKLLLQVEATTVLAQRELARMDRPLQNLGDNAEVSARRFSNAMQQVERASGRLRSAQVSLGQQIQDISVQASMGTSAFTILGQQAGQTAFALSEMGGAFGKVGTFLAGPWGSIIIAATAILGNLATQHFLASDAADKQTEAEGRLTKELTKRERLAASNPIFGAQQKAQGIINQLPAGSVIRAQQQAEFNKRFGINSAGLIEDGPLIEVTASRVTNPKTPRTPKAKKPKAIEPFFAANMESGFELRQQQAGGISAQAEIANASLRETASILSELETYNFKIEPIPDRAVEAAAQFNENLSRGLGQAIVQGQSLGDALVNSIKAAAAELISSGLLRLLSGGVGGGGGIVGSLFGGFFASGGRPPMGRVSVVGERGPELFVPSVPGEIIPNYKLGGGMGAGSGGSQEVMVTVAPSPLFITTVASASQASANEAIRQRTRSRMPMSAGA